MSYTTKSLMPLPVKDIYPHPDNPRKDIGDITELTSSIKKNGIMQNLTVIEGHHIAKEGWSNEGYTLLIGHRRFAAAKAAGLTEVPCKIVRDCDHKEQIAIMLEENMQRNDLTIYEQAQSFQLMLDLGETPQTLAQKTGFSESTIYHRVNIAKLDQDILKEKEKDESYQLTLKDMYELEKIKDIKKRNEILSSATNSENLRWKCINAAKEEKKAENWKKVEQALKDAGIDNEPTCNAIYNSDFVQLKTIRMDGELPEELPDLGVFHEYDPLKVTYAKNWEGSVVLLEKIEKQESTQGDTSCSDTTYNDVSNGSSTPKEVKKRDDLILDDMHEQMRSEMQEFIKNISSISDRKKLLDPDLTRKAWYVILANNYECSFDELVAFEYGTNYWQVTDEQRDTIKARRATWSMLREFLMIIGYEGLDNSHCCIANRDCTYDDEVGMEKYMIYDLLKKLGYTPSNEEWIKVIDGTHELYKKEDADE